MQRPAPKAHTVRAVQHGLGLGRTPGDCFDAGLSDAAGRAFGMSTYSPR